MGNKVMTYHQALHDLEGITKRMPEHGEAKLTTIQHDGVKHLAVLYEFDTDDCPVKVWCLSGSVVCRMQAMGDPIEGSFSMRAAAAFVADISHCRECDGVYIEPKQIRGVTNGCGDDTWGDDIVCPICKTSAYYN